MLRTSSRQDASFRTEHEARCAVFNSCEGTMARLTIAIDYDDTFTADPALWSSFIQDAKLMGHSVCCVTARRCTEQNVDNINLQFDHWNCQIPVFFSNLGSKIAEMERRGIDVSIWIDDDPRRLVHGH